MFTKYRCATRSNANSLQAKRGQAQGLGWKRYQGCLSAPASKQALASAIAVCWRHAFHETIPPTSLAVCLTAQATFTKKHTRAAIMHLMESFICPASPKEMRVLSSFLVSACGYSLPCKLVVNPSLPLCL